MHGTLCARFTVSSLSMLALTALLALAGCGGASTPASAATVAPGSTTPTAPFLWRVESREGRVSHLFGTIHGGVTFEEALPAPHDALLRTASAVYVESLVDDPAQMQVFAQRLMQPSPTPLSTHVGAETFDALANQMPDFPRERFDALRPWAAFFVMLSFRLMQALQGHAADTGGDPATPAVDAVVMQVSRERQVAPQPLEQMGELADIIEGVDEAVYLAMLAEFASPVAEDESDQLAGMVAAYRAGDLEGLASAVDVLNTSEATAAFFTALIAQRNTLWMPRLTRAFDAGGAFVAVGAAHMPGTEGLLSRLQAAGYTITRL
ncbi:MAG: TraB/GumN family protein [Sandaracinaceae bacterium]|nr:TraB/GumN family protein [Myxococcales bacterium]MCB9659631.1 TraB/GumN family protein [Sandaracinaceae bacterium]